MNEPKIEDWMRVAVRKLRIHTHGLNGRGWEPDSPLNVANSKWLDSVCENDAKILAQAYAEREAGGVILSRSYLQHLLDHGVESISVIGDLHIEGGPSSEEQTKG